MLQKIPQLWIRLFLIARGVVIIYLVLWISRLIAARLDGLLPASVIGMLLIVVLLKAQLLKIEWLEASVNLFIRWMTLLFVPVSVALIDQFDILLQALPALLATCVLGTLLLLGMAGLIYQWLERRS